jgi:hypothetical protein
MRKLGALLVTGALIGSAFTGGLGTQAEKSPWWMPKGYSMYFFGLSYHLREGVPEAPRKLDSNGRFVFNPGVGVGVEWLKSPFENGWRPWVEIGWFQDCSDYALYHGYVGIKYRHLTQGGWSFGFSIGGGVNYGKDWDTGEYNWEAIPIAFISVGHTITLGNHGLLPEINITYVPENNNISGTAGTDLIFTFISVSF